MGAASRARWCVISGLTWTSRQDRVLRAQATATAAFRLAQARAIPFPPFTGKPIRTTALAACSSSTVALSGGTAGPMG